MPTPPLPVTVQDLLDFELPPAEAVYDAIMQDIEPELLSKTIPTLDEKYAGETEEERATRFARYDESFATYEEQFSSWMTDLKTKYSKARHKLLSIAKDKSATKEKEDLSRLESIFNDM